MERIAASFTERTEKLKSLPPAENSDQEISSIEGDSMIVHPASDFGDIVRDYRSQNPG